MTSLLKNQAIKFLLVGILNTLFGYTVFAILIALGVYYALAMFSATCLGILFNFKSLGKLVFNNSNNKLLLKFVILYCFLYVFNIALIFCLDFFLHNLYLAGIISMLASAIVGYFCNKNFIFIPEEDKLFSLD